ncbi:MAG: PQQ-dependent sugar dehydrogenase, partial [Candidatus Kapaibacterium sp.]
VPPQFANLGLDPVANALSLPKGWTASVFAVAGLNKARFMAWGPDSVLFVANMNGNNVLALPDRNRDGIADTVIISARGFSGGHDVRFVRDTMYLAQEGGLVRLWRSDVRTLIYDQRATVIDKAVQPNQLGGNHRTRTVVLDTLRRKVFLSVGSRGNADRESDRAVIEEYEYDGSKRRVFASGTRNSVGMTLHPRTGRLWANNNGSDLQGNNIPPEWVDIVRDGGFYGYPIAYHHQRYFTYGGDYSDLLPITSVDSLRVQSMVPPAALVEAHCAPMALEFSPAGFPNGYANGLFMVMRGSWNRTPPSGAKVVFLRFDSDLDTIANSVEDFCTGFIRDTTNQATRWARPVGIALSADGSVYVSLDEGKQCILKLTPPPAPSSVDDQESIMSGLHASWNGDVLAVSSFTPDGHLDVFDASGRLVHQENVLGVESSISTVAWPAGTYLLRLRTANAVATQKVQITR